MISTQMVLEMEENDKWLSNMLMKKQQKTFKICGLHLYSAFPWGARGRLKVELPSILITALLLSGYGIFYVLSQILSWF